MSTDRRWDAPNTLHHIMARGLHGQTLFRDDRDLASIIDCVTRACSYFDVRCNAFSPVGNHYHLSALSGRVHISRFTHYVNSTFATAFNLRHGLRGYVFQGRFKNTAVRLTANQPQLRVRG